MGWRKRARASESDDQVEVWVAAGYGASPEKPAFTGTESARLGRDWNAAWEDDIATLFGSDMEISHTGFHPPSFIDPTKREASFDILLDSETMQSNLSVELTQRCAWDDFDGDWMEKSPQESEEVLRAHARETRKIPTDFKTVPNAVYEKVTAVKGEPPHPGEVLSKKYGDLERSFCLTAISFEIMRVFCGSALQWTKVKRRRYTQDDLNRAKEPL
ncbi:hypothetical protein FB45DRAFT_1131048 [Roridomyces roridus]|uniref:Uncharacterized protein n=1 Tax=Roridomyces roridus TaxID=1738132 RepID=A0AAD7B229_9AGAR|nr:hypothetical protein FB45DRAFT_1131048 [Roridomyces roridus]